MPSIDEDAPPGLSDAENKMIKDYGGWHNFMAIYNLKPWERDDIDEALAIVEAFAKNDLAQAAAQQKAKK